MKLLCKGILLLSVLLFIGNLSAKERPCKADKVKFCSEFKGDKKATRKCMKENRDKFSEACKARRAQRKGRRKACKIYVKEFCSEHRGNRKAVFQCMQKIKDKLSPECQKILSRRAKRFQ